MYIWYTKNQYKYVTNKCECVPEGLRISECCWLIPGTIEE